MERLIIDWDPAQPTCDWILLDNNGNRQGQVYRATPLDALPRNQPGRALVWLVPGTDARAVNAHIPARGRDKILRALPFALEDNFASDPDALFFALPANLRGPIQQAVAVEHRFLEDGLAALQEQDLKAQHIVPDYLALPWKPREWTILSDQGMLYVRNGEASGFSIENNLGWDVLANRLGSLSEEERPERLRYIRGREPYGKEPQLDGLEAEPDAYAEGLLGLAAQGLVTPLVLDLRQGAYSLRKDWMPGLRPWLPAASVLGLVIMLALATFATNWYQASHARDALDRQVRMRFHQVVPNMPWQGDTFAREEIHSLLSHQGNSASKSGFLALLSAVSSAARGDGNVKIESMNYQSGQLELQVHAPTVADLDNLRTHLGKAGTQSTVRSANQTSSGVEGSLMLSTGGGK